MKKVIIIISVVMFLFAAACVVSKIVTAYAPRAAVSLFLHHPERIHGLSWDKFDYNTRQHSLDFGDLLYEKNGITLTIKSGRVTGINGAIMGEAALHDVTLRSGGIIFFVRELGSTNLDLSDIGKLKQKLENFRGYSDYFSAYGWLGAPLGFDGITATRILITEDDRRGMEIDIADASLTGPVKPGVMPEHVLLTINNTTLLNAHIPFFTAQNIRHDRNYKPAERTYSERLDVTAPGYDMGLYFELADFRPEEMLKKSEADRRYKSANDMNLSKASFSLEGGGLMNRVFDYIGGEAAVSTEEARQQLITVLVLTAGESLKNMENGDQIIDGLVSYINDPRKIAFSMNPAQPVKIADLEKPDRLSSQQINDLNMEISFNGNGPETIRMK